MSTIAPARTALPATSGRDTDAVYLAAIGERVREIRARRGMSRRMLAQDSGVSERYLASLESGRGNVSILLLKQIAQAIDVTVEQLTRNGPEAPTEVALLMQWLSRLSAPEISRAVETLHRAFGAGGRERTRRIALIGLRGAGKTTLGKRLAARRRVPFIELDREIEQAAGASLAELFLLYGLPAYRRHERRALEGLLLRDEPMVIATGGSIVSEPETVDLLLSTSRVVWLKAKPEEHMARVVAQGDQRPMAGSTEAMEDLKRILAGRELLYRKADLIVDTSGKTIGQSLRLLAQVTAGTARRAG